MARVAYSRLPLTAQRRLSAFRGPGEPRERPAEPLLSVVMPVYNVENYLTEAVDSVLTQEYRNLELILIDDGATDSSGAMCDDVAARDSRVRVIHKPNGGLGAARNTGIAAAHGDYLVFIDSDDLALPGAYQAMMSSLLKSGSDLVTGNVHRLHGQRAYQAWNQSMSHHFDRSGIRLTDLPELLYDTVAWNKIFRTEFWREHVNTFPVGKLYEDMLPMFTALINASSIDVLARPVYAWRVRDEGGSITQRLHEPGNLEDRLEMVDAIQQIIAERGLQSTLGEIMTLKTLEGDLWIHLREMDGFEEEMEPRIQTAVRRYWTPAPRHIRLQVPLDQRVCYWLCERGRARECSLFREWHAAIVEDPPIRHIAGAMLLDVAACPVPLDGIPDDVLDMTHMTPPVISVQRIRWTEATTVTVSGYAYTRFISDGDQEITLLATEAEAGHVVDFATERGPNVQAAIGARDCAKAHLRDGFVCHVDVERLRAAAGGRAESSWHFAVRITDGEFVRTTPMDWIWRSGSAALVGAAALADGTLALARTDQGKPFTVELERPSDIRASTWSVSGTTVSVAFPSDVAARRVWLSLLGSGARVEARRTGSGGFTATLPAADGSPGDTWRLHVAVDGDVARVLPPLGFTPSVVPAADGVRLEVSRFGRALVHVYRQVAIADSVMCVDGVLELAGALYALDAVEFGLAQEGAAPGRWHAAAVVDGRFTVRVETSNVDLDDVRRPLPAGRYELFARRPGAYASSVVNPSGLPVQDPAFDPVDTELLMSAGVVDELPTSYLSSDVRVKVSRITRSRMRVDLAGPVPEEHLGKYNEARFTAAAGVPDRTLQDAVFYYVDLGYSAGDSALALHHELRRLRPELTHYWGVDNLSVAVPDGGVPILRRSREWFDKVNVCRFLVNNYGGLNGLVKHPDQRYLQTWHGTPLKLIGVSEASHKRLANSRLPVIAREASEWDGFVSPSPYMNALIRSEMLYHGAIIESGYPRNDRLAKAGEDERLALRRRLSLPDSARVLLYAPTFRERQRDGWRAAMFDALDLPRLLSLLGPDWWVVLRGHSFNARADHAGRSSERLVDATRHRDINDLYLAADVLLTDYSSVMFDFCVTGKPIAYFTPDLEHYVATRGTYFDLAQSAPGPLYTDVDQLAAGLADIEGLEREYSNRYAAFRARYAPWDDGHAAERVVEAFFT